MYPRAYVVLKETGFYIDLFGFPSAMVTGQGSNASGKSLKYWKKSCFGKPWKIP